MTYQKLRGIDFFKVIHSEKKAREWIWKTRFPDSGFQCRSCAHTDFFPHYTRPEVRTCKKCRIETRLRAGTIFEASKLPLLVWLRAIHLLMQGKRGISALELQRVLKIKSYYTAWQMLHKIRAALRDRDERYKLRGLVELDGTCFGRRKRGNQKSVLIAIESKDWVDEKKRTKVGAGFAKVTVTPETRETIQPFVDQALEKGSWVNTDGKQSYRELKNVEMDYQTAQNLIRLDGWLPWVHKFISNAKTWLLGTHHGVEAKYLDRYLAEYTYRFNRRHDPDSLFHRALKACTLAQPRPAYVLFR